MGDNLKKLEVIEASLELLEGELMFEFGQTLRTLLGRRIVYRGSLIEDELEVVAKCFLPHAKQERDWRREWQGLTNLQSSGFPVPSPYAVCRDDEDNIYVLMQYLEGATTLCDYLEAATLEKSKALMVTLAGLVDKLHVAGARQMDQHVDNCAVVGESLYLLDAGTYRFGASALSASDRCLDIAAICVSLPPYAEALFRSSLKLGPAASVIESAILDVQKTRARRYYKKTQRSCTEFIEYREEGRKGMSLRSADSALAENFFRDPESIMKLGLRLKSGNTCTVQAIEFGEKSYILKRYNRKPFVTQLRRSLFSSRARRSWSNACIMNLAFIPTAMPVAFLEIGNFPRNMAYLLMERIDGELLPEYVARFREDDLLMKSLVQKVGGVWDSLARLRAVHGDLKATNLIVSSTGEVYLFDLDSLCVGLSNRAYQRGRKKDMRRFLQNWASDPQLAEVFRKRMQGGDPS
jgi:tRNA A-37 threonylcarbamoyl transferase component Bud32